LSFLKTENLLFKVIKLTIFFNDIYTTWFSFTIKITMFKLKKLIFKQIIFLSSIFFKPSKNYWLISLSHGGGSFEAENCKKFAQFLKKQNTVNFKCVSEKIIKGLENKIIRPYSLKYIYYSIFSKFLIVENDLHNDLPGYRSHNTYKVNLFHGMAVKKIYHSSRKISKVYEKNFINILKKIFSGFCFTDEYDLISVSNTFHKKKYISAFQNRNVYVLGQPRNDFLKDDIYKIKKSLLKKLGIKKKINKIILFLPTFRDKNMFFEKQSLNFLKIKKLQNELKKNNSILLSKHHYFYEKNFYKKNNQFSKISDNIFSLNKFSPTYNLLKIGDCLITDYSSVYIDYLLLDRPIFFYCHDIKNYKAQHRELYFDYFNEKFTPGKKVQNENDLINTLSYFLKSNNDAYKRKRLISKNFFNKYSDNNNSRRIYKFIVAEQIYLKFKKKIINSPK